MYEKEDAELLERKFNTLADQYKSMPGVKKSVTSILGTPGGMQSGKLNSGMTQ
jgi:hypothetical protein